MSHLPAERLAALADDASLESTLRDAALAAPLTAEEAAHLAACAECARERDAHRALLALAADERARLAPPLTSWGAIAAQLRDEGLLATGGGAHDDPEIPSLAFALTGDELPLGRRARRPSLAMRWGRRAAAAALFVVGGVVAGRASAGLPPLGVFGLGSRIAADSLRVANDAATAGAAGAARIGEATTSLVSDTMTAAFRSTTEALVALARAEREYQVAAAYLLAHDSSTGAGSRSGQGADSSEIYRARLAALDNVMAASREALYEAPHDPVINRYYLATVASREATLQQLNTALPAGARLTRF
jgi:hypothetical protein